MQIWSTFKRRMLQFWVNSFEWFLLINPVIFLLFNLVIIQTCVNGLFAIDPDPNA